MRRVYIEKPNGKLRPLGIPTIKDRVAQMAVKLIIEPIFEADFTECSHGYRPGRSAKDAVEVIEKGLKSGKNEVYDADLSGYFDTIPHDKLMACVRKRMVDGSSWDNAFRPIQGGVDASSDGDTVWVSNGVYTLSSQVVVTSGVTVGSINGWSATTVDGADAGRVFYLSGGQRNEAWEKGTTISGGRNNNIVGECCTIGGGMTNTVDGYSYYSTIPGGYSNRIYDANYCFAAGRRAQAWHNGCFVWADGNDSDVNTTTPNQFMARASGGFVFLTAVNGITTGAQLPAGSGSWSSLSDRNAKENIAELNGAEVLDKLMTMPISTWNYRTQDDAIRHAGPMAQDFHAAYGLGEMETMLSSVDVDGIALAAIEELKAQKDAEIGELKAMIEVLRQRLDELEPPP